MSAINTKNNLRADCENCFALCCVGLHFAASVDFAVDKLAGTPCTNLRTDYRCGIHKELRQQGYKGCTVFECFGAGQKVSQVTFKGVSWRENPKIARDMFDVFPIMQELHEILSYLTEARTKEETLTIHKELSIAIEETEKLTRLSPDLLLALNIPEHRARMNTLLVKTSELVRKDKGSIGNKKKDRSRSDLLGANLRGADLRGVNFRGAYLIAADLRKADMRYADLIGADFRDANLSGADLTGAIFLTQVQINSAKGDNQTKLPVTLMRPMHWI